jgi:hypothetical protein
MNVRELNRVKSLVESAIKEEKNLRYEKSRY